MVLKNHHDNFKPQLIHTREEINNIYGILGIVNYQDFIYMHTFDSIQLNNICNNNPNIKNLLLNISFNDMFGSHLELVTDINRIFIKSMIRFSSPLLAAVISMALIATYEVIQSAPILT